MWTSKIFLIYFDSIPYITLDSISFRIDFDVQCMVRHVLRGHLWDTEKVVF